MKTKNMGFGDQLGYYLAVLLTLGGAWLTKCIILKAIEDSK